MGIISDTHGLLRADALAVLRGCELIIHAGDIGAPEVLDALRELAPLVAIRGNNDRDAWAQAIPEQCTFEYADQRIHLLHDLKTLTVDLHEQAINVVISGHSHKPKVEARDGVLYLNPGSAGPRRFSLPVTIARLRCDGETLAAEIVELV